MNVTQYNEIGNERKEEKIEVDARATTTATKGPLGQRREWKNGFADLKRVNLNKTN